MSDDQSVRPINEREAKEGEQSGKPYVDIQDNMIIVKGGDLRKPKQFTFDHVFAGSHVLQEDIYNDAARETLLGLFDGYNGTIFAYGQTGAGKTFTMFGPSIDNQELKGIIPRSIDHVFEHIDEDESGTQYTIKCSFLEIYKERVRDLLRPENDNLKVRESPQRGVWVDGLSEIFVGSAVEVFDLLSFGEKSRKVASTGMNNKSSEGSTKEGTLNLADLAGSEKVKKTGASGQTLEEAKKINQSLSALGNCINALTTGSGHVPYRNSKLTFILKESLGGNAKTTLLIACSSHSFNMEETISTLNFGKRAKTIKNKVKVNQQRSVKELEAIVAKLTSQVRGLRAYITQLEKDIIERDPEYDLDKAKGSSRTMARMKAPRKSLPSNSNPAVMTPPPKSARMSLTPNAAAKKIREEAADETGVVDPILLAEMQTKFDQYKDKAKSDIEELKSQLEDTENDHQETINELESLKSELEAVSDEHDELKAKYQQEIEELTTENHKYKYDSEQKQVLIEELKNELDEVNSYNTSKIKSLEEDLEETTTQLKENTDIMDVKIKQVTDLEQSLSETKDDLDSLRKEHENISGKLKQKEAAFEERDKVAKELFIKLKSANSENEKIKLQLQERVDEMSLVSESLEEAEAEVERLTLSLDQSRSAHSEASEAIEKLNYSVTEEHEKLRTQYKTLRKENLELNSNFSLKIMEINELREEKNQLSTQNKLLNDQIAELNSSFEDIRGSYGQESDKQKEKIRGLEFKICTEETNKVRLEMQINSLNRKLSVKEDRIATLENEMQSESEIHHHQIELKDKEISIANERILELEEKCEHLSEELIDKQERLDGSVEAFHKLNDQLLDMYEKIEKLGTENAAAKSSAAKRNIVVPVNQNKQIQENARRERMKREEKNKSSGLLSWFTSSSTSDLPTRKELAKNTISGKLKQKTGILGAWRERLFVLKENVLFYFNAKTSTRADGKIDLVGFQVKGTVIKPQEQHKYQFILSNPQTRTELVFCSVSEKSLTRWVSAIDAVL